MKKHIMAGLLSLSVASSALAGVYSYSGGAYAVPDGNPVGAASSLTVSGEGTAISDITVSLNVSGGYNGDLYAYLSYGGVVMPLVNRVGLGTINGGTAFGSADSGFAVTLNSTGSDVHWASASGGVLSGAFGADGRSISPISPAVSFDTAGRVTLDGQFSGMNPNGTWTLFFADLVSGGGTSMVNGWSLDITAVPEPVNVAVLIFGVGLIGVGITRRYRGSRKMAPPSARIPA